MKKTFIVTFRSGPYKGQLGLTEYLTEKHVSVYASSAEEAVELAKTYTGIRDINGMEINVV